MDTTAPTHFANNTTTAPSYTNLSDLQILRSRALNLRTHLNSSRPRDRILSANVEDYIANCKPRVVLIKCYESVGLVLRNDDYLEEKAAMLEAPLSDVEIGRHVRRVEWLIEFVRGEEEEMEEMDMYGIGCGGS